MHNLRPILAFTFLFACGGDGGTSDTTGTASTTVATDVSVSSTGGDGGSTSPTTSGVSGDASTGASATTGDATTGLDTSATLTTGGDSSGGVSTTDATTGGLLDGSCRSDADCDGEMFEFCFAPDEHNCGACQIPDEPCDAQMKCAGGFLCVPFDVSCACDPDAKQCVPVVTCKTDRDCADEALFCDKDQVCAPKTCDGQMFDCPALFDCVANSPGDHCVRHMCVGDGDCDGGVCVEGRCFDGFGDCQPPAP